MKVWCFHSHAHKLEPLICRRLDEGGVIIPFVIFLWGQKTDDTKLLAVMPGCIPEKTQGTHPLAQLLDRPSLSPWWPLPLSPLSLTFCAASLWHLHNLYSLSRVLPLSSKQGKKPWERPFGIGKAYSSLAKCTSATPVSSITAWQIALANWRKWSGLHVCDKHHSH